MVPLVPRQQVRVVTDLVRSTEFVGGWVPRVLCPPAVSGWGLCVGRVDPAKDLVSSGQPVVADLQVEYAEERVRLR